MIRGTRRMFAFSKNCASCILSPRSYLSGTSAYSRRLCPLSRGELHLEGGARGLLNLLRLAGRAWAQAVRQGLEAQRTSDCGTRLRI